MRCEMCWADSAWEGKRLILSSIRRQDGKQRFKVIGFVGPKLFSGVFTWRDYRPRFMSVRRSNKGEEKAYHSDG